MSSCRRTEIRSAHLALKGRPRVGDKGLKTPSSADNRLIDTTQTAREESEIFIRKPEVRDPVFIGPFGHRACGAAGTQHALYTLDLRYCKLQ